MNSETGLNGIRGIVFDAVGTLIKPVPSVAEAYTAAASRQGVVIKPAEVRERFQHHFQNGDEHAGNGLLFDGRGDRASSLASDRRRRAGRGARSRPGVRGALGSFQPARLVAVLSRRRARPGRPGRRGDLGLRRLEFRQPSPRRRARVIQNWSHVLDSLVISSEVGYRKPHPLFFHAVCNHLGLPEHQVLCVGDDSENDVRGAIQAGLSGILIDRAGNRPADLPHVPVLTALVEMRFVQKRPNSRLQSR